MNNSLRLRFASRSEIEAELCGLGAGLNSGFTLPPELWRVWNDAHDWEGGVCGGKPGRRDRVQAQLTLRPRPLNSA